MVGEKVMEVMKDTAQLMLGCCFQRLGDWGE